MFLILIQFLSITINKTQNKCQQMSANLRSEARPCNKTILWLIKNLKTKQCTWNNKIEVEIAFVKFYNTSYSF